MAELFVYNLLDLLKKHANCTMVELFSVVPKYTNFIMGVRSHIPAIFEVRGNQFFSNKVSLAILFRADYVPNDAQVMFDCEGHNQLLALTKPDEKILTNVKN